MRPPRPAPTDRRPRIGLFAASSPFPEDRYRRGAEVLTALGFDLVEHPHLFDAHGYLAGHDRQRLAQLHDLLDDPSIDALWAVRGGYGLHRIVDQVDVTRLARAEKAIVGFSDVVALHALAQAKADLITIHGPVVTQLGELGPEDRQRVAAIVGGQLQQRYAADGPVIHGGIAEGPLLGGCLSVIAPLLGTGILPRFEGAILLLEDIGEATYRIDRLLTHLRLSGLLSAVAGVALGDFVACEPRKDGEQTITEVLADRLGDLGVPVLAGLPIGHGARNAAVPLGARARLDATAKQLQILAPA
ncbi:MAG: LD-carboxypeptidase [Deltaproteobacteria bacterium]|nr:LD-carboxypeptidase [Deltaproteobacteria bacterium]